MLVFKKSELRLLLAAVEQREKYHLTEALLYKKEDEGYYQYHSEKVLEYQKLSLKIKIFLKSNTLK